MLGMQAMSSAYLQSTHLAGISIGVVGHLPGSDQTGMSLGLSSCLLGPGLRPGCQNLVGNTVLSKNVFAFEGGGVK